MNSKRKNVNIINKKQVNLEIWILIPTLVDKRWWRGDDTLSII